MIRPTNNANAAQLTYLDVFVPNPNKVDSEEMEVIELLRGEFTELSIEKARSVVREWKRTYNKRRGL